MCHVLDVLKDCLRDVIAHAQNGDRLSLLGFSSEPSLLCDWIDLGGPKGAENRRTLCACVEAMEAGGGTRLVPALQLSGKQLSKCIANADRSCAVVLLSDGDPEEPPEALSSAAADAFGASPMNPLVVALALGHESRPDLMALLAQCGCGASLYISSHAQLPSQLGRMWGILDASQRLQSKASGGVAEAFLVLEPAEGVQLLESERSPGGTAPLISSDCRQLLALRCGRHAPGAGDGSCRLAARLSLPSWAKAPLEESMLQRPLLRTTWVWRNGDGAVKAVSNVLRAVQVPALVVEAKLGLPLRVVLAVDSTDCDSFDHERFLGVLAASLGMEKGRLELGRVTPGSINVDLCLLDAAPGESDKLGAVEHSAHSEAFATILASHGFEAATFSAPGRRALRRVLQWRLAAALEAAAEGLPGAQEALGNLVAVATSDVVKRHDISNDPLAGGAAAVAADAAAALETMSSRGKLMRGEVHALQQQSHAHCQQLCPERHPGAAAVACYELPSMEEASAAFEVRADIRSKDVCPAAPLLEVVSDAGTRRFRIRSQDPSDVQSAISTFKVDIHYGNSSSSTEIPVSAGTALAEEGILAELPAPLEPGSEHAVVVSANCGCGWGEQSQPLLCTLWELPSSGSPVASPSRRRHRARRSSLVRSSAEISLTDASATAVGTLSLSWQVQKPRPDLLWSVHVEAMVGEQTLCAENLRECQAGFTGLDPSTSYRFTISAEAPPEAPHVRRGPGSSASLSFDGLAVTGSRFSEAPPALPRTLEGVVVLPPFEKGCLAVLEADPFLKPIGTPGTYLRIAGRSRSS